MAKITSRSLVKLINEMLVRYEIKAECIKVVKTRFRPQDYEGGARIFYAIVKSGNIECEINGFDPYHEIEYALAKGKMLTLIPDKYGKIYSLQDYYISYI